MRPLFCIAGGDEAIKNRNDGLSERKKLILRAIVDAHIAAGEPVGSKFLTQNKQLSCSPATIRNEMAELEALGYLEHPYTSSGRVPSDLGYRFYVDSLIQQYSMTSQEIAELNQLMQNKVAELDKLLERATKIASAITNYTGLAVKPKPRQVVIVRYETVFLDEKNFILVMITAAGAVKTKYVTVDFPLDRDAVSLLAKVLTENISGASAEEITLPLMMKMEEAMGENERLIGIAVKHIYETMGELDGGDVRVEGVNRLLQYPEYSDVDRLREMFGMFEKKDELLELVSNADTDGVNIYIGSENGVDTLNKSTLIFKTVKQDGRVVGAIGVIGPSRMNYSRVIATVNQLSSVVSGLIEGRSLPGSGPGDSKEKEGDS